MSEFKLKFHPNPRQLNFNILLREFSSVAFSIVCGVSFNQITNHEPAFAGIFLYAQIWQQGIMAFNSWS